LQHHHQRPAMAPRPDTAGELRRRLTAPMVINNIDEPIENLVVGAAMQTYVDDNDTNATTETAFDVFIEKLLEFPKGPAGERDRRNLVRERTRGMLKWVKPYLVTLRKQQLLTVRSIVEMGRPIEALALPVPIQEKLREVIGAMLPHSTASIGFDKRFQRSKLDSIGRPPPPADILDFKNGVTPADQFYSSHTIHVDYASEFRDRPTRKRWPGSKIQVYPIAAKESDYGKPLPAPKQERRAPRTSVAERQRYVCRFDKCKCAFSRKYTLQLHERTHLYSQDHYFWKHAPKLGGEMDFAKDSGVKYGENGSVTMEDSVGLSVKRKKRGSGKKTSSKQGRDRLEVQGRKKKQGRGKK